MRITPRRAAARYGGLVPTSTKVSPVALGRLSRLLLAGAAIAALAAAFAACGDDDDADTAAPTPTTQQTSTPAPGEPTKTPAPPNTPTANAGTTTPTAEANNMPGFIAALQQLNKDLASGRVDALVSRMKVIGYTCTAADVAGGLGTAEGCTSAGQQLRAFQTSSWRSEGGLRPVEAIVANLQGYQANFDTSKSDQYGAGTFRVYAYDPTNTTAVITVTSKCLPQFQCPAAGFQRLVWVPAFEYIEGRWKISSLMYAFVLGEEFLDPPSAEVRQRMPQWTEFE